MYYPLKLCKSDEVSVQCNKVAIPSGLFQYISTFKKNRCGNHETYLTSRDKVKKGQRKFFALGGKGLKQKIGVEVSEFVKKCELDIKLI